MARFLTVSGKVRILIAGWWFQTRFIFHFIYGTILRIDFHSIIFQDAYGTTNQNTLELIEHMLHSLVGLIKLDYVECQVGHLATSKCHLGQPLKYPIDQHECAILCRRSTFPSWDGRFMSGFAVDYSSWCVVINLPSGYLT